MERWPCHETGARWGLGMGHPLKLHRWRSWPIRVVTPWSSALSYLKGVQHRALPVFHLFAEGRSILSNHFLPSFSEDQREYNKIKQSKLEYEGSGLDIGRNFPKEGGWALNCITSGMARHIVFWAFHNKNEFPSVFKMFLMESLDGIGE